MDAFDGRQWHRGWLDPWCGPDACRLTVHRALVLGPVTGAYFVQPRDWRRVWNYVSEIGPREVARKIASRRREATRNEKYVSLVSGTVVQGSVLPGAPPVGARVVALCPLHPFASERVVVHAALTRPGAGTFEEVATGTLATALAATPLGGDSALAALAGWHPESGHAPDATTIDAAFVEAIAAARQPGLAWTIHDLSGSATADRSGEDGGTSDGRRRVALFGYGQYAKTIVVPNLDPRLRLAAIHEVDPAQLATARGVAPVLDASPLPRDDGYDVYVAAGYHHTHAPIACAALERGASAIVEKPPVTTRAQLDTLLATWRRRRGGLYTCFQRRYASFTAMAREDLVGGDGPAGEAGAAPPISYRCLVYEVPLPPRHWYRWPASRGRVVSNGCHWIDHFLFVNGYAPVTKFDGWTARNGDSVCVAELANGAAFSMAMTDQGSDCIGMQNVIEMRAGATTVRIVNDGDYRAEDRRGLRRRGRQNKMAAFAAMYRAVSAAAVEQRPIDTPEQLEVTAGLMLDLDAVVGGHEPGAPC